MLFDVIHPVTWGVLLVASYIDLRTREVPDWISYGLIFAGIGVRSIYGYAEGTWSYVLEGTLGILVMFILACIMFYTGQWGGGDSKLLIGLGALFGLTWKTPFQFTVFFLVCLFVVGALYGSSWSTYLFLRYRKKCTPYFLHIHRQGIGGRNFAWTGAFLVLTMGIFLVDRIFLPLFLVLGFSILLLYYTWLLLHALEKTCMQKAIAPAQLTEGDWIVEDVVVNGKRICGPSDLGIEKNQIALLKRYYAEKKVGKILIKEGIPFVPVFLMAYLLLFFVL